MAVEKGGRLRRVGIGALNLHKVAEVDNAPVVRTHERQLPDIVYGLEVAGRFYHQRQVSGFKIAAGQNDVAVLELRDEQGGIHAYAVQFGRIHLKPYAFFLNAVEIHLGNKRQFRKAVAQLACCPAQLAR
jgi:hypothetical protein